jgi:penicillin-binding protein 2
VALQQESKKQLIQQRMNLLRYPVFLVFFILAARLWQLQIIQGSEYAQQAEHNRMRIIEVVAPRGTISDRNHIPLVENRPSFDVLLYRESMRDLAATTKFLATKLGISSEDLKARLDRSRATGRYRPIVVKEDVSMQDISLIEAYRGDHPEIQLGPEPRRLYHYGKLAAHLLGYLGEISEEELSEDRFPGAKSGSLVGQSGVERIYNHFLVGKDGERQVLVDSMGREVGLLSEVDSTIGGEVQLTLDLDLQAVAEKALEGKVGSIIAMDPRNGEILAMANSPSYDPNDFSTHISENDWRRLINDPQSPMQNRAIQSSYSPGSVFKPIIAVAALDEGIIDERFSVTCTGSVIHYGRAYHCLAKNGHGRLKLEEAIARSCNIFFYEVGRRLGISKINGHARALGLGVRTGVDLPGERAGVMPGPEWKQETYGSKWYAGETISVSIGQGAVSVTPLQILRAISAIATEGKLVTPHLLLHAEGDSGSDIKWPITQIPIDKENFDRVREGMWRSVNDYGTGHNAAIPGLDLCGKTGTAQVIGSETKRKLMDEQDEIEDHSWFVGFGRRDNPEIAVVVFIEHGGMGGVTAAPLAKQIFMVYFNKNERT